MATNVSVMEAFLLKKLEVSCLSSCVCIDQIQESALSSMWAEERGVFMKRTADNVPHRQPHVRTQVSASYQDDWRNRYSEGESLAEYKQRRQAEYAALRVQGKSTDGYAREYGNSSGSSQDHNNTHQAGDEMRHAGEIQQQNHGVQTKDNFPMLHGNEGCAVRMWQEKNWRRNSEQEAIAMSQAQHGAGFGASQKYSDTEELEENLSLMTLQSSAAIMSKSAEEPKQCPSLSPNRINLFERVDHFKVWFDEEGKPQDRPIHPDTDKAFNDDMWRQYLEWESRQGRKSSSNPSLEERWFRRSLSLPSAGDGIETSKTNDSRNDRPHEIEDDKFDENPGQCKEQQHMQGALQAPGICETEKPDENPCKEPDAGSEDPKEQLGNNKPEVRVTDDEQYQDTYYK